MGKDKDKDEGGRSSRMETQGQGVAKDGCHFSWNRCGTAVLPAASAASPVHQHTGPAPSFAWTRLPPSRTRCFICISPACGRLRNLKQSECLGKNIPF